MTGIVESREVVHTGVVHSLGRRIVVLAAVFLVGVSACGPAGESVEIDDDDIGGVVSGPDGPEAGVWVIAEPAN